MDTDERKIYVVGHRNPDTDSICSAIAYAELKKRLTGDNYEARRAGRVSAETAYVLEAFSVKAPEYLESVKLQVKDLDRHEVREAEGRLSIKEAWNTMKEIGARSMPIVEEGHLRGLISTGDIAKSYMDVYDNEILSRSRTEYRSIANTLNGKVIEGNDHGFFHKGKVTIAAASPEMMEEFIGKDDLVIVGNRYESQLCAIELGASCLVVTQDAGVSKTIRKLASERDIVVIVTPFDTFTAARLINQSIPVKFFMTPKEKLVCFRMDEYVEDVRETMAQVRYRDFPVIGASGMFKGFISRRRLMAARKKQVILVDHNEKSQTIEGIEDADILEIIDHHRIGSLETMSPVFFRNQPVGCTATIISQMYEENAVPIDKKTAGLLCAAIISDTLLFRSPTSTPLDRCTAEKLAGIAEISMEDFAMKMFEAGSDLAGKTAREICLMDFKEFEIGDVRFGAGQISSMNAEELRKIGDQVYEELEILRKEKALDYIYFMLTNIIEKSTTLLCAGKGAEALARKSFTLEAHAPMNLKGVVSRKKQVVPNLAAAIREE